MMLNKFLKKMMRFGKNKCTKLERRTLNESLKFIDKKTSVIYNEQNYKNNLETWKIFSQNEYSD